MTPLHCMPLLTQDNKNEPCCKATLMFWAINSIIPVNQDQDDVDIYVLDRKSVV